MGRDDDSRVFVLFAKLARMERKKSVDSFFCYTVWNGSGSASVKVARMYSMGRAKDSSGFVLLGKLARLGRAQDSSGFFFVLTLARTHSLGRVQDASGFVLFA